MRSHGPGLCLGRGLLLLALSVLLGRGGEARAAPPALEIIALHRRGTVALTLVARIKDAVLLTLPGPLVEAPRILLPAALRRLERFTAPRLTIHPEADPCARGVVVPLPAMPAPDRARPPEPPPPAAPAAPGWPFGAGARVLPSAGPSDLEAALRAEGLRAPPDAPTSAGPLVLYLPPRRGAPEAVALQLLYRVPASHDEVPVPHPTLLPPLSAPGAARRPPLLFFSLHATEPYELQGDPIAAAATDLEVRGEASAHLGALHEALTARTLRAASASSLVEFSGSTGRCWPCVTPPLWLDELEVLGAGRVGGVLPALRVVPYTATRQRVPGGGPALRVLSRVPERLGGQAAFDGLPRRGPRWPGERSLFQTRYYVRPAFAGPQTCARPDRGHFTAWPPGHDAPEVVAVELDEAGESVSPEALVVTPR